MSCGEVRAWSLTVVVSKYQQGEFLQSLSQLIVRPTMLSGPVSDEDHGPGKKDEAEEGNMKNVGTMSKGQYNRRPIEIFKTYEM